MMLDAYIGRLDDPQFVAERNSPDGAVPRARSPLFPHGSRAFDGIYDRIKDGRFSGGATQHIAYVAPASKMQIQTFFNEVCLSDELLSEEDGEPHLREQMRLLQGFIDEMQDDGQWALVAVEL